jgi:cell division inhibitor SulA
MIARLVAWIQARGLGSAAILFLQANKPLALIASQAMLLLQPIIGFAGPTLGWFEDERTWAEYSTLLEDPANIDRILFLLER